MSKQIIKQVVNGVEKLLVVEVVEEIDIAKIKKDHQELIAKRDSDYSFIEHNKETINFNKQEIEKLKGEIISLENQIKEFEDLNAKTNEDALNTQKELDELTAYINEINNVEQLSLPLEEVKVEEKKEEIKIEQPKPVFNKPVRRFGR